MKRKIRPSEEVRKIFQGSSAGFTLIEVLVALALFGIIAITFLGGLTTASRAVLTGDVRTTAESLARTQMEYVKSQGYSDAPWDYEVSASGRSSPSSNPPSWWDDDNPPLLSDEYAGYTVAVEAEVLDDPDNGTLENIQEITVTVSHEGRAVITLGGYKVNR